MCSCLVHPFAQAWPTEKTSSASGQDGSVAATGNGAGSAGGGEDDPNAELREKLRIVRTVLEQASFNGINRKVQIKPIRWRPVAPQVRAQECAPDCASVSLGTCTALVRSDLVHLCGSLQACLSADACNHAFGVPKNCLLAPGAGSVLPHMCAHASEHKHPHAFVESMFTRFVTRSCHAAFQAQIVAQHHQGILWYLTPAFLDWPLFGLPALRDPCCSLHG